MPTEVIYLNELPPFFFPFVVASYRIVLYLCFLLIIFWGPILIKRRIESWIIKKTEDRQFSAAIDFSKAKLFEINKKKIPFFGTFLVHSLLSVLIFLSIDKIIKYSNIYPNAFMYVILFSFFGQFLALLFYSLAVYMHIKPNSRRHTKYNFLFYSCVFLSLSISIDFQIILYNCGISFLGYILPIGFFLAIQIFISNYFRQFEKGPKLYVPSQKLMRIHRIVSNYTIIFITFMIFPMFLCSVLLLMRYYTIYYMSFFPILYLRSFRYANGPTAFTKIISGPSSRIGVVFALAHKLQPPSELHGQLSFDKQAHASLISDEDWKIWLIQKLRVAFIVIIDLTIESDSLSWELSESLRLVPNQRIIIFQHADTAVKSPELIECIRYDLSKKGIKKARKLFKIWLDKTKEKAVE